jgi:hypothetical protein
MVTSLETQRAQAKLHGAYLLRPLRIRQALLAIDQSRGPGRSLEAL